jgi:hypothetical protein
MKLTGKLVDADTVAADLNCFSVLALRCHHETDVTVVVLIEVPAHKCCFQAVSLIHALKWSPG